MELSYKDVRKNFVIGKLPILGDLVTAIRLHKITQQSGADTLTRLFNAVSHRTLGGEDYILHVSFKLPKSQCGFFESVAQIWDRYV
jgi:hypothetical protein